ncbi:hypothetical protein N9O84_02330 [Gammaproteobacteria bacterium]|nr:hypothetical protein [Gammaproteobacteria bacterium]
MFVNSDFCLSCRKGWFYVLTFLQIARDIPRTILFISSFRRYLSNYINQESVVIYGGSPTDETLNSLLSDIAPDTIVHLNLVRQKPHIRFGLKQCLFIGADLNKEISASQINVSYSDLDLVIASNVNRKLLKKSIYKNILYFPPTLPIIITFIVARWASYPFDIYKKRLPRTGFIFISLMCLTFLPKVISFFGISSSPSKTYVNIDSDGCEQIRDELDATGQRNHCSMADEIEFTDALLRMVKHRVKVDWY